MVEPFSRRTGDRSIRSEGGNDDWKALKERSEAFVRLSLSTLANSPFCYIARKSCHVAYVAGDVCHRFGVKARPALLPVFGVYLEFDVDGFTVGKNVQLCFDRYQIIWMDTIEAGSLTARTA